MTTGHELRATADSDDNATSDLLPLGPPRPRVQPDEVIDAAPTVSRARRHARRARLLFLATCASTLFVGVVFFGSWLYAPALLSILVSHELGHLAAARRHGIPASPPFFLPLPLPPFGTLGAVIGLDMRRASRRALFDVAVAGPLAGLVPTVACLWLGAVFGRALESHAAFPVVASSPLFEALLAAEFPTSASAPGNALIYAGWVGLFITSLNLLPIGQLDGGHLLHALMPRLATTVSNAVLLLWILAAIAFGWWWWLPMILLIILFARRHPPVPRQRLDWRRHALGWATLALLPATFLPEPLPPIDDPAEVMLEADQTAALGIGERSP
ncbi:MAG: site-2 protease family protein [Acidobacteriota bacterium]